MVTFFMKFPFLARTSRDRICRVGLGKMLIALIFARIIMTTKRRLSRSVLLAVHRRESPNYSSSFTIARALSFRRKSVLSFDFLSMVGKGIVME
jgi:hypothetical protein